MNYYIKCFKNYVNFKGRASRKEFWWFSLIDIILIVVTITGDNLLNITVKELPYGYLFLLYSYALLLPRLAVTIRRLHDTNKSGLFVLIIFVPLVGSIWFLILMLRRGDEGDNDFGSDPYEIESQFKSGNVNIMVSDIPNAIKFYTESLGLKLKRNYNNHWAKIEGPGITIGLLLRGNETITGDSISITFEVANIEKSIAELEIKGIKFLPNEDEMIKLAFFTDPDNNPLYLVENK